MAADPPLAGMLPRWYGKDNIDQRRLGELIELLSGARVSQDPVGARDLMGEVYEYFLGNFARAEGRRGGEFFTPPSVVRLIVEVLEPSGGRVYDPCCGSGGMFVQTENIRRRARRRPERGLDLRSGKRRANLADGEDEPRHSRHRQRRSGNPLGRHICHGPACRTADGLCDGQSAVQHQGLGPRRSKTRGGASAFRRPPMRTTPGFSTSSPSWRQEARPAW